MTSVTIFFALLVVVALSAIALALSVLFRRERSAARLTLAFVLTALAVAAWWLGLRSPVTLP